MTVHVDCPTCACSPTASDKPAFLYRVEMPETTPPPTPPVVGTMFGSSTPKPDRKPKEAAK